MVNLRALNQFLQNFHFKIESIASLKDILQEKDLKGQLDLKDAYLAVPIARSYWRYLRF